MVEIDAMEALILHKAFMNRVASPVPVCVQKKRWEILDFHPRVLNPFGLPFAEGDFPKPKLNQH